MNTSNTSSRRAGNPLWWPAIGLSLFGLLGSYKGWVALLVVLALLSNLIALVMPLLISRGIDAFGTGAFNLRLTVIEFTAAAAAVLVFTYLLSLVQVYVSELVARDLRSELAAAVSRQSYAFVQRTGSSLLLTNLTSDIDAVKMFVSQAISTFVSSISVIVGSAILLLLIDAPLALVRGRRRKRFLVRADRNVDLSAYLATWRARVRPPGAIRVAIDVDPYSFL